MCSGMCNGNRREKTGGGRHEVVNICGMTEWNTEVKMYGYECVVE